MELAAAAGGWRATVHLALMRFAHSVCVPEPNGSIDAFCRRGMKEATAIGD